MTFYIYHNQTNPKAKLKPSQVFEIIEYAKVVPYDFVAGMYGVSYSTVFQIVNGQRWNSVTALQTESKQHRNRRKQGIKLNRVKVSQIRRLYSKGQSQNSLARKYKVTQPVIFDIVHRRTFK